MFKQAIVAALATFAVLSAPVQAATVLSFDSAGVTGYDNYTQSGYTFKVASGNHIDSYDSNGVYFHNGSANSVYDNWARLTFSGGLFDLSAFTLNFSGGELRTNLNAGVTTFGTGVNNVSLTGLTWVEFSPLGNGATDYNALYLDNVTVDATRVPEPSTLALLGLGMLGFGTLRARKR